MNQAEVEALYSQRNKHTVLHEVIAYELDKTLLNWGLIAFTRLPEWLKGDYYDSKANRLLKLKELVDAEGLERVVVATAAAIIHTHSIQTIQQAVGYLQAFMPHEDAFERATTAAEIIGLLSSESGLYHIKRNGSGSPATISVNHWSVIDKKLLSTFKWINSTCFNPPMIEPPVPVSNNIQCGYHTLNEPLILGSLTMHHEKQNCQAVNTLNKIEWVLDPDVIAEPEVPSKPLETTEQKQQFTMMARASQFIYRMLGTTKFWLCWQYDSRGRMYSHGYHVNLQSNEYKKACLSFNNYEVLT